MNLFSTDMLLLTEQAVLGDASSMILASRKLADLVYRLNIKQEDAICTSDEWIATPGSASLVGASAKNDAIDALAGIYVNHLNYRSVTH